MAERIQFPRVKVLFLDLAIENEKRSAILKKSCVASFEKKMRMNRNLRLEDVYGMTYMIYREIVAKEEADQQVEPDEMLVFAEKFLLLEKALCGKYSEDVRHEHPGSSGIGKLFASPIKDSTRRQEILGSIKSLFEGETPDEASFVTVTSNLPVALAAGSNTV